MINSPAVLIFVMWINRLESAAKAGIAILNKLLLTVTNLGRTRTVCLICNATACQKSDRRPRLLRNGRGKRIFSVFGYRFRSCQLLLDACDKSIG